jgi:Lon protease-like protein
MIEVALFPIPNSVNFPGIPCSLHVFEPRYRKMVRHCVDNQLLMGVCHTEKVLHSPDNQHSPEKALQSNQATYKPCDIFSAGPVSLLEELEDGRMLIEVDTNIRLQLKREVQTLPFNIWACEDWPDEPITEQSSFKMEQSQQKILQRLIAITHSSTEHQQVLKSDYWQHMTAVEFSFLVIGMVGMDAGLKQELLEMTEPIARLERVLAIINQLQ